MKKYILELGLDARCAACLWKIKAENFVQEHAELNIKLSWKIKYDFQRIY